MCLGVPGRITDITRHDGDMRMGRVQFGGIAKEVCLSFVPDAGVGDFVIVHAGFAISRLDEDEAARTLSLLAEMDGLGGPADGGAEGGGDAVR